MLISALLHYTTVPMWCILMSPSYTSLHFTSKPSTCTEEGSSICGWEQMSRRVASCLGRGYTYNPQWRVILQHSFLAGVAGRRQRSPRVNMARSIHTTSIPWNFTMCLGKICNGSEGAKNTGLCSLSSLSSLRSRSLRSLNWILRRPQFCCILGL